jgi:hypothetical protein
LHQRSKGTVQTFAHREKVPEGRMRGKPSPLGEGGPPLAVVEEALTAKASFVTAKAVPPSPEGKVRPPAPSSVSLARATFPHWGKVYY